MGVTDKVQQQREANEAALASEVMVFAGMISANIRRLKPKPHTRDKREDMNPLDLVTGMVDAFNKAVVQNDAAAWADVGTFAMQLSSMSGENKARLDLAPRIVALMIGADHAAISYDALLALGERAKLNATTMNKADIGNFRAFLQIVCKAIRPVADARKKAKVEDPK